MDLSSQSEEWLAISIQSITIGVERSSSGTEVEVAPINWRTSNTSVKRAPSYRYLLQSYFSVSILGSRHRKTFKLHTSIRRCAGAIVEATEIISIHDIDLGRYVSAILFRGR